MTTFQIIGSVYIGTALISLVVGVLAASEFNESEHSKMDVDTAIPFSVLISLIPGVNLLFLLVNLVMLILAFYTNKKTVYFDEDNYKQGIE